jgi:hypothetical protein
MVKVTIVKQFRTADGKVVILELEGEDIPEGLDLASLVDLILSQQKPPDKLDIGEFALRPNQIKRWKFAPINLKGADYQLETDKFYSEDALIEFYATLAGISKGEAGYLRVSELAQARYSKGEIHQLGWLLTKATRFGYISHPNQVYGLSLAQVLCLMGDPTRKSTHTNRVIEMLCNRADVDSPLNLPMSEAAHSLITTEVGDVYSKDKAINKLRSNGFYFFGEVLFTHRLEFMERRYFGDKSFDDIREGAYSFLTKNFPQFPSKDFPLFMWN